MLSWREQMGGRRLYVLGVVHNYVTRPDHSSLEQNGSHFDTVRLLFDNFHKLFLRYVKQQTIGLKTVTRNMRDATVFRLKLTVPPPSPFRRAELFADLTASRCCFCGLSVYYDP